MGSKVSSMLQDEEINLISEETGFPPAQIERLYERFKSLDKSGICGSLSRQDFLRVPELAINPLCERIVNMFFVDCDDDHERINFRQFMKVLATFRSSSKPMRFRQASRQESIQNILNSLSQNKFRHSRHSSCDGFLNYYPVQQHHTTNQHSVHYVASTTHLAQNSCSSFYSSMNSNFVNPNHYYAYSCGGGGGGQFKKQHTVGRGPFLDSDEPANSRKQKLFFMFKIYDVDNDDRVSLEDLKRILKTMVGNYISETKINDMAAKTMQQADRNKDGFIDFDEFCTAFLHKDIDESLRVKFTASNSSIGSLSKSNSEQIKRDNKVTRSNPTQSSESTINTSLSHTVCENIFKSMRPMVERNRR